MAKSQSGAPPTEGCRRPAFDTICDVSVLMGRLNPQRVLLDLAWQPVVPRPWPRRTRRPRFVARDGLTIQTEGSAVGLKTLLMTNCSASAHSSGSICRPAWSLKNTWP